MADDLIPALIAFVGGIANGFIAGWALGWWRGYDKAIWRMTRETGDE